VTSGQLFRKLLVYALRYWRGFAVAIVAMVVTAAAETAFPAMMKPFFDNGFQANSDFQIWWVPTAVMLLFLLRGASGFVASYMMQWVSQNVLRDIRQAMFEKMITLPASSFDQKSSGQLISKIMNESQQMLQACTNVLTILVRDSLVLVGLLGWMLYINWQLTMVVVCLIPILATLTHRFSRRLRGVSKSYLHAISEVTRSVEEAISGHRVIKIFDGEHYEQTRFRHTNSLFRAQAMRIAIASALQSPLAQLVAALGVSVVLTLALLQSRSGGTTVGDFASFITAMLMMFSPLRHLTDANAQLQGGLAAAENAFAMLDEPSERDEGSTTMARAKGDIRFEGVSLQYPGRPQPAIDNIHLHIPSGKTYAFVGPSGGGKTSLMSLLPRLYEPNAGGIYIDDTLISSLSLRSLRQQLALVSQDVVLFNDSIRANIAYGREDLTDAQVWDAVSRANLGAFIESLPDGFNTIVGDRGVRLSGGQRQRIAIARAVIKDAPILILDEATSALDTLSERAVQASIEALRANRTTLIVAHRLSSVVSADCIVVLQDGRIVQQGTHAHLMKSPGLYQSLYAQMAEEH